MAVKVKVNFLKIKRHGKNLYVVLESFYARWMDRATATDEP
jgi:hypothetical protein